MKKILSFLVLLFSISTFSQTTEDQIIIEKTLYSELERETMFENFKKGVPTIGMNSENEKAYMDLITSNFTKMVALNKDRNTTQKELKQRFKRILESQRVELKKILTFEELKRHQQIYKPIIESVRSRIDNYEVK